MLQTKSPHKSSMNLLMSFCRVASRLLRREGKALSIEKQGNSSNVHFLGGNWHLNFPNLDAILNWCNDEVRIQVLEMNSPPVDVILVLPLLNSPVSIKTSLLFENKNKIKSNQITHNNKYMLATIHRIFCLKSFYLDTRFTLWSFHQALIVVVDC